MSENGANPMARARSLAQRLLRPTRPKLAEAIEVVTGLDRAIIAEALASPRWSWLSDKQRTILEFATVAPDGTTSTRIAKAPKDRITDPREAWEMLAGRGVIPDDWVGTTARRFARGMFASAPPTITGVVAIASDPDGVLECERLAKEMANRLVQWGVGKAPRVVWHVDEPLQWVRQGRPDESFQRTESALPGGDVMHELLSAIGYSVPVPGVSGGRRGVVRKGVERSAASTWLLANSADRPRMQPIANLLDAWSAWERAVEEDRAIKITVAGAVEGSWVVRTVGVRELPDPFEPLFMILERGYILIELTRRSVQLYAESDLTMSAPTAPRRSDRES